MHLIIWLLLKLLIHAVGSFLHTLAYLLLRPAKDQIMS